MNAWRSAVRDNYVTTLGDFQAENESLVTHVYRARPDALADTRSIFVGGISETITLDSGTFGRVVDVEIVCAIHLTDNAETTDDLEEFADALVEWLAANDRAHCLGAHTEQHPIRSTTIELPDGGIFIPAIAITCRASMLDGRT